jgi:iron complex outermembrane receptor protein
MKTWALLLFWIFGTNMVWGQKNKSGKISLKVVEINSQKPVPLASVGVSMGTQVFGGFTNDEGFIQISNLPLGCYEVKISAIGFETPELKKTCLTEEKPVQLLGTCSIQANPKVLQGADIQGSRTAFEIQLDKKVFNVGSNATVQGGTALQVLENVPSVSVDQEGKVSLRGTGNANIFIDGKPSNLSLQQIPASSIDNIELITNPSAKYDPDGMSGIINIVLKKNKANGLNGVATAVVGYGGKYSSGFNINYKKGAWNFFANANYRDWELYKKNSANRINYLSDSLPWIIQFSSGFQRTQTTNTKAGAEYSWGKNTLSTSFGFTPNNETSEDIYRYQILALDTIEKFQYSGAQPGKIPGYTAEFNALYNKKFENKKEDLTVSYQFSKNLTDQFNDLRQDVWTWQPLKQTNANLGIVGTHTLQLDRIKMVQHGAKWEYGGKVILRNTDRDLRFDRLDTVLQSYFNDASVTNRFVYDEKIYAVYSTYTRTFGKWNTTGGLRIEQTNTQSDQLTQGSRFLFNYGIKGSGDTLGIWPGLFPSFAVSRKVAKNWDASLSYSRRLTRPNGGQVNPFRNLQDPLNIFIGNPYLRPEYIHSFDFNLIYRSPKFTFTPALYFRQSSGEMWRFRTVDSKGISTTTFINFNQSNNYGSEFTLVGDLFSWWNLNANVNVFYYQVDATNLIGGLVNRGLTYNAKAIQSFKIKKGWNAQVVYNYRGKLKRAIGVIDPIPAFDFSLRKDVMKGKGNLTFAVNDAFNQRYFRINIADQGQGFAQEMRWKTESRIFTLAFNYYFGRAEGGKKPAKVETGPVGGEGGGGF